MLKFLRHLAVPHRTTVLFTVSALLAGPVYAEAMPVKEAKPGLLKQARITPEAATSAAQARVPKGKIVSAEIEQEHGKLLYSFDIRTEGRSGIDEVIVDAMTGKLDVQHETPADEAREKAADKKKAAHRL